MRLAALASFACAALFLAAYSRPARADDTAPNAERLRSAASEYDAGRRAFGEKDYENAATHFENAFHDAANASAIRSAIRARKKAGQLARAATLANLASVRYPKDAATMTVVHEVLKDAHGKLDRITLRCTPDCGVAADGRAISNADGPETVFYLDPGDHPLVVSWSSDRNKASTLTATAGGEDSLIFEAPPLPAAPAHLAVVTPEPVAPSPATTKPLNPAFFYSGAAATAIALGVTVWSGVDAENNPGTAAVKRDCVGLGTNCPEYKEGLSAQLRTNVLIGTTAVLGAATGVVGVFFTRWSGGKPAESRPAPIAGSVVPLPGGGAFSLSGRF
jgi:hypothetical protein